MFSFSIPRWGMSLKWPVLCWVGCKTLTITSSQYHDRLTYIHTQVAQFLSNSRRIFGVYIHYCGTFICLVCSLLLDSYSSYRQCSDAPYLHRLMIQSCWYCSAFKALLLICCCLLLLLLLWLLINWLSKNVCKMPQLFKCKSAMGC